MPRRGEEALRGRCPAARSTARRGTAPGARATAAPPRLFFLLARCVNHWHNPPMPVPGKRWRHVIINTRCTWHHGDQRGFRSRGHRIHSSGDYKNPPPRGEHAGLYRYRTERAGPEVHLPFELRPVIGRAIAEFFRTSPHRLLTVAVGKVHVHALIELPDRLPTIKQVVGDAKRHSSRIVKNELPGSIWAAGGTFKPVDNPAHQRAARDYILYDQGPDAWTWCYRDKTSDGCFGRKRPSKRAR
jgi:hypothetical protein